MKRIFCLITALCLIFGSFSFCFAADWSATQISSVVSDLSTVKTTLNNIYTRLGTIMNYLYDDGHSVGYWASAIASWMQPIYQALTNNLVSALDIEPIIAGLNEVVYEGGNTSYFPYLKYDGKSNANWLSDIYTVLGLNGNESFNPSNVAFYSILANGGTNVFRVNTSSQKWPTSISQRLAYLATNQAEIYSRTYQYMANNYNTSQTALNWTDIDSSYTFTPSSVTNGIYSWLATIQAPVARLSYVLASDERIEAQEAAAANEEAVVDNFIDSTGAGSASPSDIGSISDLSSGYKSNFGSDASISGIFNIFNSNNMGWFSQETANQLDTTTPTRRGSSFDTPLLDQQIRDIYDQIGVVND